MTVVGTGVADIRRFTRTADVIIAAAGAPGMITADMGQKDAAVVAAGVSFVDWQGGLRRRGQGGRGGRSAVAHRWCRADDPGDAAGSTVGAAEASAGPTVS